ncbi:MAG: hypothetical protein U5L74_03975 [Ideonella sp.]|nr:hypothetical protein [Ideonella sp.]
MEYAPGYGCCGILLVFPDRFIHAISLYAAQRGCNVSSLRELPPGETLQILAFTALAFVYLKDKLGAKATISLDLDWFYRMGGRGFLWLAKHPIQWLDNTWGVAYREVVGLYSLMTTAKFWSWFDWHGIDGVVDGSADV